MVLDRHPDGRDARRSGSLGAALVSYDSVIQTFYDLCEKLDRSPTVREVCAASGLRSSSTVQHHLRRGVEEGKLKHREGKAPAFAPAQMTRSQAWGLLERINNTYPDVFVNFLLREH